MSRRNFLLSGMLLFTLGEVSAGPAKNRRRWNAIVEENNNAGFTKRMIPLEFLPEVSDRPGGLNKNNIFMFAVGVDMYGNGLWLNHQDKLIKFKDGRSLNYIIISFQDLYDVRIDKLGISKTKGWAVGNVVSATTTEFLRGLTIQIIVKDPNGGVKTFELMVCHDTFNAKIGSAEANAVEKCATAIINEISWIIDN